MVVDERSNMNDTTLTAARWTRSDYAPGAVSLHGYTVYRVRTTGLYHVVKPDGSTVKSGRWNRSASFTLREAKDVVESLVVGA
jgi:hypothetical protein